MSVYIFQFIVNLESLRAVVAEDNAHIQAVAMAWSAFAMTRPIHIHQSLKSRSQESSILAINEFSHTSIYIYMVANNGTMPIALLIIYSRPLGKHKEHTARYT